MHPAYFTAIYKGSISLPYNPSPPLFFQQLNHPTPIHIRHTMLFNAVTSLMTLFVITSMGVQPVQAAIIAYSGTACDGSAGLDVPCDGSCHSFDTRHSFVSIPSVQLTSELPNSHWYNVHQRVASGAQHCVTTFVNPGCPAGDQSKIYTFTEQNGQCTHVNTGTPIKSFICSGNNICLV